MKLEVCISNHIADSFRQMTVLREEQQRSASSWGWPEECRYRDPVSPASRQPASVCTVYVHCCAVVVFYLRKRTGPQGRCLTFLIEPNLGNSSGVAAAECKLLGVA